MTLFKRSGKHFFNINPFVARKKLHKDIAKVGLLIINPINYSYRLSKGDVKWVRAGVNVNNYYLF